MHLKPIPSVGALLLVLSLPLVSAHGAIVRFTATLDAAQEGGASTSTATGSAIALYDTATNTIDLVVSVSNFTNTVSNSHIHEGALGVSGPVVVGLGAEAVYTRTGANLSGSFQNLAYAGTPATLLTGGAYVNLHSAAFPAGEIRGQLMPDPVKLTAILSGSQEVPARTTNAYGAAQATFNTVTNTVTTLVCVYNFTNTLTDSHIHEAPAGTNGGVRTAFGGAANYQQSGTTYVQLFSDRAYSGTALLLLNDGAYVNVHSNVFGGGEIRGQLRASSALTQSRLINVSARGQVGTGDGVLIAGFVVRGLVAKRVLVRAAGPALVAQGVSGVLENPQFRVHAASTGAIVGANDDWAGATEVIVAGAQSGAFPFESGSRDAAAVLTLAPGGYTVVVSGVGETVGNALVEVYELP